MTLPTFAQDRGGRLDARLKGVTLRTAITTRQGSLVVYDAPRGEVSLEGPGRFLVYWHGAAADEVHVYGRLIQERSDLVHALRWLEHDFGVDPDSLADRLFADPPEFVSTEVFAPSERNLWFEATRDRVMEIAGLRSAADFDPTIPPVVVAAPPDPCLPCAVAGGAVDPSAGSELDPYEAGVMAACECCIWPPCPNCVDTNVCTHDECNRTCGAAWCVHHWINCNDDDPCTIDGCNSQTGCYHLPNTCDDGDVCTTDRCNPDTGVCENNPVCPGGQTCCPLASWLFCCNTGETQCCPWNPTLPNHCCLPDQTCCGGGCCNADQTCCNGTACCNADQTCCNGLCGTRGSCCFFGTGACTETTGVCCQQQGGTYQGDGTSCTPEDLCRPWCENCHQVIATFNECAHEGANDDCSPIECFRNILDTATCDFLAHRRGPSKCDTRNTGILGGLQQNWVWVISPAFCNPTWSGGLRPWVTIYNGCGGACYPQGLSVRCDAPSCDGPAYHTEPLGTIRVCGCPGSP